MSLTTVSRGFYSSSSIGFRVAVGVNALGRPIMVHRRRVCVRTVTLPRPSCESTSNDKGMARLIQLGRDSRAGTEYRSRRMRFPLAFSQARADERAADRTGPPVFRN
jgi:hypothetical protein